MSKKPNPVVSLEHLRLPHRFKPFSSDNLHSSARNHHDHHVNLALPTAVPDDSENCLIHIFPRIKTPLDGIFLYIALFKWLSRCSTCWYNCGVWGEMAVKLRWWWCWWEDDSNFMRDLRRFESFFSQSQACLKDHPSLSSVSRGFTNTAPFMLTKSAIIFFCWTLKVRVMSWLMNLPRRFTRRRREKRRFVLHTRALNIINYKLHAMMNISPWYKKNFIKLILFSSLRAHKHTGWRVEEAKKIESILVVDHQLRLFNDLEI
jgi:hypothetical protein